MAAACLPDPLIEIAVKSIRAYEAVDYQKAVKAGRMSGIRTSGKYF